MLLPVQFLPQTVEFPSFSEADAFFVLCVFALLQGQNKQHSLPVTPRFPLPEAQGLLLSRARAESSPGEQRQEKSIGAGSEAAGGDPVWLGVQFGWACRNRSV